MFRCRCWLAAVLATLHVNLAGFRAAGADLTSALLKLATVYQ